MLARMSYRLLRLSFLSGLLCTSTAAADPTASTLHSAIPAAKPAKAPSSKSAHPAVVKTGQSTHASKPKSATVTAIAAAAHVTSPNAALGAAPAAPPSAALVSAPPRTSVRVPETAQVKVDVPAKLQALLDDDSRMVPWLAATMATIDGCHATDRGALGTLVIELTMHENARPSADVGEVASALRGVFACAMAQLMQAERMPLFTGPEGQKHSINVRFVP